MSFAIKASAQRLQFDEAVAVLAGKVPEVTRWAGDRAGPWHAKAFTVAGLTNTEALADVYAMTKQAQTDGVSLAQFRRDFVQKVQDKGWLFRHERKDAAYLAWRADLIYNNALRGSYMAGRWQQLQDTKADFPYLQYTAVLDFLTRAQHRAWDGMVRRIDDDFWLTHYPPCGFNCRCTVIALSEAAIAARGLKVEDAPYITKYRTIVHKGTGGVMDSVPEGIDQGFDTNVGIAWNAPELALGKKLAALPDFLRGSMIDRTITPAFKQALNERWKSFTAVTNSKTAEAKAAQVAMRKTAGNGGSAPQIVGFLGSDALAAIAHAALDNVAVIALDRQTLHLTGQHKRAGRINPQGGAVLKGSDKQVWPDEWYANLPQHLSEWRAVVWDVRDGTFFIIPKRKFNDWLPYICIKLQPVSGFGMKVPNVVSLGTRPISAWGQNLPDDGSGIKKPRYVVVSGSLR